MSIANTSSSGNKGSNFDWQHRVLIGLQEITNSVSGQSGQSGLTDTELRASPLQVTVTNQINLSLIEARLSLILAEVAAVNANTDTVESLLADVITEITNEGTVNNTNLLNVITELQGIDANTDSIEASLTTLITNQGDLRPLDALTDNIQIYGSDDGGSTKVPLRVNADGDLRLSTGGKGATTEGIVTSTNQSADRQGLDVQIRKSDGTPVDDFLVDVSGLATQLSLQELVDKFDTVSRVSSLLTVTGAATAIVAAGARSASFFNAGNNNVTVAGGTLEPGMSVTFNAGGEDDTLATIAYVTIAASKLVISTVV